MFDESFSRNLCFRVHELLVEKQYETDPLPLSDQKPIFETRNFQKVLLDKDISFRIKELVISPTSAELTVEVDYGTEVGLEPQDKISAVEDLTEDYASVEKAARRLVAAIWLSAQIDMNNARRRLLTTVSDEAFIGGLPAHMVKAKWKAGQNVQIPAASYSRYAPCRDFVLVLTNNLNVRAVDRFSDKVEPLVAGEKDLDSAVIKLRALYPDCHILTNIRNDL